MGRANQNHLQYSGGYFPNKKGWVFVGAGGGRSNKYPPPPIIEKILRRSVFMSKRVLFISLGVIAFILMLGLAAVAGGAVTYFALQAKPARAALISQTAPGSDEGILIAAVDPEGPSAQAGVVRGDILTEVNGQKVNLTADLSQLIADSKPGDTLKLMLIHGDNQSTVDVKLGDRNGSAYLGITPCGNQPLRDQLFNRNFGGANLNGALIRQVTPDSPAAKAGLQVGEIIVSIDGEALGSETDLAEVIHSHKPGDTISLSVKQISDEQAHEVQVTLGENPDQAGQAYLGVSYVSLPVLRAPEGEAPPFRFFPGPSTDGNNNQTPQPPSGGLPFSPDLPELPNGVDQALIIAQVQPNSPAEKAGLQPRDLITAIDGKPVGAPQAFAETIQSHKPGDQVTLTVYRKGESSPLSIQARLGENPTVSGQAYLGVTVGVFIRESQDLAPQSQPNFGPLPGEPAPYQGSGT
jgi:S1-C subfamily serine protease